MFTGSGAKPNHPTGWVANHGSTVSFNVPDNWTAGRIWGRQGCDSSGRCANGGCGGGMECVATGATPATLAEFTFKGSGGQDFYDVSLVDGFNLPMSITNNARCGVPECKVDLNPGCPAPLKGPVSNGHNLGCKSACIALPNPTNSRNCCSGQFSTPDKCPASGVQFYNYFKGKCPKTYVFAYDEKSGNAIYTCPSSKSAHYTVTFCP
ncbi:hypothetical protein M378DRAFT_164517 [Amanita muscaria Koide BX008]|uniref:Thaumatin-like protein n=1 Tax=Amanita muscaria (strain Koide BX008) TaxID=946122 RepID=A0A0C2T9U6_AMAMK|nr:hypothetical protein M378DRAFT_164517 [Amanita muscaria Koide BX008]